MKIWNTDLRDQKSAAMMMPDSSNFYVTPEEIERARQTDLLSYLREKDPSQLVHVAGQTYCTLEHDSLKINNGKWYYNDSRNDPCQDYGYMFNGKIGYVCEIG